MPSCFLCGSSDIEIIPVAGNPLHRGVKCSICGFYVITDPVLRRGILEEELNRKHFLISLTRQASDAGSPLTITTENIHQLLDSIKVDSPLENLNLTLLLIMKKQHKADEYVELQVKDFPLVYAHDINEFRYLVQTLINQNLLEHSGTKSGSLFVRLTPEGWEQALELRKIQLESNQAFVAMSFAPELNEAWQEGIKPALESTGFRPYRVDQEEYNEKIDDRIISGIRQSGLLVADFTGHRQGVYFEAGFAMGLGIPVIYTCKNTDIDVAHFDTRQYNHIVWSEPSELNTKLSLRISATIPNAKVT